MEEGEGEREGGREGGPEVCMCGGALSGIGRCPHYSPGMWKGQTCRTKTVGKREVKGEDEEEIDVRHGTSSRLLCCREVGCYAFRVFQILSQNPCRPSTCKIKLSKPGTIKVVCPRGKSRVLRAKHSLQGRAWGFYRLRHRYPLLVAPPPTSSCPKYFPLFP